ncbi:hypothetical protein GOP47_0006056 [Adiantum capillus-veneris]|uniref:Uncharacterized protein n=1 Tax=Adiantum capillus-veneris TaxID=13818 RepID=A0A9D4ZMP2_ADICA|nr:hypothetical protein GOP47_0006056 [Adiantum capillus-veneris]
MAGYSVDDSPTEENVKEFPDLQTPSSLLDNLRGSRSPTVQHSMKQSKHLFGVNGQVLAVKNILICTLCCFPLPGDIEARVVYYLSIEFHGCKWTALRSILRVECSEILTFVE